MTIEEAKKFLPIIQAYAEGKTIQVNYSSTGWKDSYLLSFNGSPSSYRIKPETKYRLFVNAEECWAEMLKHQPFGWVKTKDKGIRLCIIGLNQKSAFTQVGHKYDEAFDEFTFADGSIFGIKEEG